MPEGVIVHPENECVAKVSLLNFKLAYCGAEAPVISRNRSNDKTSRLLIHKRCEAFIIREDAINIHSFLDAQNVE